MKSKGKVMVVTLSDEDGNFITFTAIAIVDESGVIEENPSDRELSEDAYLQEIYNKLCKLLQRML